MKNLGSIADFSFVEEVDLEDCELGCFVIGNENFMRIASTVKSIALKLDSIGIFISNL